MDGSGGGRTTCTCMRHAYAANADTRSLYPQDEPLRAHLDRYDPLLGREVTLTGLSTGGALNGSTGIVMSYDEDKGRYSVRLSSSARLVGVKAENLHLELD